VDSKTGPKTGLYPFAATEGEEWLQSVTVSDWFGSTDVCPPRPLIVPEVVARETVALGKHNLCI